MLNNPPFRIPFGDKKISYLTFIPDEFFWAIACVFFVRKRFLGEFILSSLTKMTLPKLFAN